MLDPKTFGFPMKRRRRYCLGVRLDTRPGPVWSSSRAFSEFPFAVLGIRKIARLCGNVDDSVGTLVSAAEDNIHLTADDFLLSPPLAQEETLASTTEVQAKAASYYVDELGARICDLRQDPRYRPRWGTDDFPVLTTGCDKLLNVPAEQYYSPKLSKCFCL